MKHAEGDAYVMNRNRQLYTHAPRLLLSTAAALLLGLGVLIAPGPAQAASAAKEAPSAAAQTVYDYWAAIDRHDYSTAYAQFSAAYRQDHGFERFALTQWSSVQHAGNVQIVHEDAAATGRLDVTAQVDLTPGVISPYPAGANTFVYRLVEQNGAWRIEHVISSVEDVAVAPAPAPAAGVEVFVLLGLFAALFAAMTAGALLHSDRVR
jgi:hypothetical protein